MERPNSTLLTITSLDLGTYHTICAIFSLRYFVEDFGFNLASLAFNINARIIKEYNQKRINLANCRKLQTLTIRIKLWPNEGHEMELHDFAHNADALQFTAQTLNTCRCLPSLTGVAFVFSFWRGKDADPDTLLEYTVDSPELQSVEDELLALFETTPLEKVHITPLPDPFRFDYNAPISPSVIHPHTWQEQAHFPRNVFPRIRAAGKLKVIGNVVHGV